MAIKDINLVIFPLGQWDSPYSSTNLSLALEFSKYNKVMYLDTPLTLFDILVKYKKPHIKKRIKRLMKGSMIQEYNKNLLICYLPPVISINFLPRGYIYNLMKSFNEWIVFSFLNKKLNQQAFEKFIYINIFNPFYNHSKYINANLNIYYTVDNISEAAHINKHGVGLEKNMIKLSDFSLGTSLQLVNQNKEFNSNFHYLPNAANLNIFNPNTNYIRPTELVNISSKTIIFSGHLDNRSDISLIYSILEKHRDKVLVIVGFVSLKEEIIEKLKSFSNILFVPPVPLEKMPAFLCYADCAIIPYKINEQTNSIYPLKINEYLAMGIPVVSTCFSQDITQFSNVISLSNDQETFCQLIETEITENNQKKQTAREMAARNNTWENRVKQFWSITENHKNNKTYA